MDQVQSPTTGRTLISIMFHYLDEVDTLDDVDTELEVDTLTGKKTQ